MEVIQNSCAVSNPAMIAAPFHVVISDEVSFGSINTSDKSALYTDGTCELERIVNYEIMFLSVLDIRKNLNIYDKYLQL